MSVSGGRRESAPGIFTDSRHCFCRRVYVSVFVSFCEVMSLFCITMAAFLSGCQ